MNRLAVDCNPTYRGAENRGNSRAHENGQCRVDPPFLSEMRGLVAGRTEGGGMAKGKKRDWKY